MKPEAIRSVSLKVQSHQKNLIPTVRSDWLKTVGIMGASMGAAPNFCSPSGQSGANFLDVNEPLRRKMDRKKEQTPLVNTISA